MADDFYKLYCEEVEKNEKLMKENKYLKGRVRSLSSQLDYLMENQDKIPENRTCSSSVSRAEEYRYRRCSDRVLESEKEKNQEIRCDEEEYHRHSPAECSQESVHPFRKPLSCEVNTQICPPFPYSTTRHGLSLRDMPSLHLHRV